jgi:hypothetical protein
VGDALVSPGTPMSVALDNPLAEAEADAEADQANADGFEAEIGDTTFTMAERYPWLWRTLRISAIRAPTAAKLCLAPGFILLALVAIAVMPTTILGRTERYTEDAPVVAFYTFGPVLVSLLWFLNAFQFAMGNNLMQPGGELDQLLEGNADGTAKDIERVARSVFPLQVATFAFLWAIASVRLPEVARGPLPQIVPVYALFYCLIIPVGFSTMWGTAVWLNAILESSASRFPQRTDAILSSENALIGSKIIFDLNREVNKLSMACRRLIVVCSGLQIAISASGVLSSIADVYARETGPTIRAISGFTAIVFLTSGLINLWTTTSISVASRRMVEVRLSFRYIATSLQQYYIPLLL